MKTVTIPQAEVKSVIGSVKNGSIFTVAFVKKNGEIRDINCRKGVVAGVKPDAKKIAPDTTNITVFDMVLAKTETNPAKCYRKINPETVLTIKANKITYVVR